MATEEEDPTPPATTRDRGGGRPAATTRDGVPRSGGAPPTTRDGIGSAGLTRLPTALAAEYDIVEELGASGAEADLLVVRARSDERLLVVKIYRPGITLDTDMLERIEGADREHVVAVERSGSSDGRWYEVLEYVEAGSFLDLLAAEGPGLNEGLLMEIVGELAPALAHLHERGVVHRDIKPANVLVRRRRPLDLILADFGLAAVAEHSMIFMSGSRTAAYAAPEAAAGAVSPARDYWSLGMMVLESLQGEHPFARLSEAVINTQLATRSVDVSGVEDDRWRLLCQGLLTRNPDERWGAEQVRSWLDGDAPDVAADTLTEIASSRAAYKIGTSTAHTQQELAVALTDNWGEARERIGHNMLYPWFLEHWPDQNLVSEVRVIMDPPSAKKSDPASSPDVKLLRLLRVLDPGAPPRFRGAELTAPGIAALARAAAGGNKPAATTVKDLRELRVFDFLGESTPADVGPLVRTWEEAIRSFTAAAEKAARSGAPTLETTVTDGAAATLLNVAATPAMATRIREHATATMTPDALAQPWFAALGDPQSNAVPHALLQGLLAPDAERQTQEVRAKAEAEREQRVSEEVAQHWDDLARLRHLAGYGVWLGLMIGGLVGLWPAIVFGKIRNRVLEADAASGGYVTLTTNIGEVAGWLAVGVGVGLLAGLLVSLAPRYLDRDPPPREWRPLTLDIGIGTLVGMAAAYAVRIASDRSLPAEIFDVTSREVAHQPGEDFWVTSSQRIIEFYYQNEGAVAAWSMVGAAASLAMFVAYLWLSGSSPFLRWGGLALALVVLAPFTIVVVTYVGVVLGVIVGAVLFIVVIVYFIANSSS